jgi:hypothetical protein
MAQARSVPESRYLACRDQHVPTGQSHGFLAQNLIVDFSAVPIPAHVDIRTGMPCIVALHEASAQSVDSGQL